MGEWERERERGKTCSEGRGGGRVRRDEEKAGEGRMKGGKREGRE